MQVLFAFSFLFFFLCDLKPFRHSSRVAAYKDGADNLVQDGQVVCLAACAAVAAACTQARAGQRTALAIDRGQADEQLPESHRIAQSTGQPA